MSPKHQQEKKCQIHNTKRSFGNKNNIKPGIHRLSSEVTPFILLNSNDLNSSTVPHSGKTPPIPDITTSVFVSVIFSLPPSVPFWGSRI